MARHVGRAMSQQHQTSNEKHRLMAIRCQNYEPSRLFQANSCTQVGVPRAPTKWWPLRCREQPRGCLVCLPETDLRPIPAIRNASPDRIEASRFRLSPGALVEYEKNIIERAARRHKEASKRG